MVTSIACDIHPLCNVSVVGYLKEHYGASQAAILDWFTTWMHRGFNACEQVLAANGSRYSFGEQPGMADLCLVPQVYNARRFEIDLEPFPNIERVVNHCNSLRAFIDAEPANQPDSTL